MIRCGVLSYESLLSSQVCGVLKLLIQGRGVHDTMRCAELRVTALQPGVWCAPTLNSGQWCA
jgi:hypothetical protein